MKVYTKTGDKGQTALIGCRVSKAHPRINIVGALDEVMVLLGQLISNQLDESLINDLKQIYKVYFIIQSKIVDEKNQLGLVINPNEVTFCETKIDQMNEVLPKLKNFIYYTGHPDALLAHQLRAKVRGVERLVVALNKEEKIDEMIMNFLNRSSDYFYVLGRYINHINKYEEEIIKL